MAITVEELQILLKCDATQAEAALNALNTSVDKAVKKMEKGGSKESLSFYEKTSKKLQQAMEQASKAFSEFEASGDSGAKANFGHYIEEAKKLTKQLDDARKSAEKAKTSVGEVFSPTITDRAAQKRVPYTPWAAVSKSDLESGESGRIMREARAFMANAANGISSKFQTVDTTKLTSGTLYEQLAEKLKVVENQAESIRNKIAAIGDGANPQALMTLQTKLETAERKAEKLAKQMAEIEDSAGASGNAESPAAQNIKQTGEEANKATPKVREYNKEVQKSGKSSSFFSRVSKAAHGVFSKFGNSFKHHEGFLSKFGATLKRVIMRMMAMGLVRGVLRGITQGMTILGKASTEAERELNRFTALGNSVKASFGSAALSVLNAFAPVLYNIANAAITAANAVSRFFAVFGSGEYYAVSLANGFDSVGEAIGGASGKAKGLLADFDELNVIGSQSGGGGGSNSANIGNTTVGKEKATSILAELFKSEEFDNAGIFINRKLEEVSNKVSDWFDKLRGKNYGKKFAELLNGIFKNPKAFEAAGSAVANGINTVVDIIYKFLSNFDAAKAAQSLAKGLNQIVNKTDWNKIGLTFGKGVNTIFTLLQNFFTTFDFKKAAKSLADALSSMVRTIDWDNIGQTVVDAVLGLLDFATTFMLEMDWSSIILGIIDVILGVIDEILSNPIRLVRIAVTFAQGFIKLLGTLILSGIEGILATIDKVVGKFVPDWKPLSGRISGWWNTTMEEWNQKTQAQLDDAESAWEKTFGNIGKATDNAAKKVDGLSSSLNKVPKNINTKWSLNAEVTATGGGGGASGANVRPTVNINLATTMASGGIAYGETLARIGEYAGARSNPEVVAPLSKLKSILDKSNNNSKDIARQNALLSEQNQLLRVIADKKLEVSPTPELGQVVTRAQALYGAV